jgi:hypothetical protein
MSNAFVELCPPSAPPTLASAIGSQCNSSETFQTP